MKVTTELQKENSHMALDIAVLQEKVEREDQELSKANTMYNMAKLVSEKLFAFGSSFINNVFTVFVNPKSLE